MYQVTAEQRAELNILIAEAKARPVTQKGAWSEVYQRFFEFITVPNSETPIDGVDHNVWLWVRGARHINAGDGPFAELIREYTEIQHEIHFGQELNEGQLNLASNQIAENFFNDVLGLNADGTINTDDTDGVPNINMTGNHDAGPIAATIFNENYSPWAGTLLFTNLGENSFFKNWILTTETVEDRKTEPGTYELIASATSIQDFSPNPLNLFGFISETIFVTGQTLQYASVVNETITETNNWFRTIYGLTSQDYSYTVGNDTFGAISTATNISKSAQYGTGTTVNDVIDDTITGVEHARVTGGHDVIHAGQGDDIIQGSYGNDIIDGGVGIDKVDYSQTQVGIKITTKEKNSEIPYTAEVTFDESSNPALLLGTNHLYDVEEIIGSQYIDSLIIEALPEDLKLKIQNLDGQANEDITTIIDASAIQGGVSFRIDPYGNGTLKAISGVGGTIDFENLYVSNTGAPKASAKFTNDDDFITGSIGTVQYETGGGNDVIKSVGVNSIIYSGTGDDKISSVGSGTQIFTGAGSDIVYLSDNFLLADASSADRLFMGTKELSGALHSDVSESPWASHYNGFLYSQNPEGQLIISFKGHDDDFLTYVADYNNGLIGDPTANITVLDFNVTAGKLIEFPKPDNWIDNNFEALDYLWKAWFGEERKPGVDPLVLDLDGDGLELRPQVLTTPSFDLDGDSYSEPTGWVLPDDGFLAIDLNNNGTIDGIDELFGSATEDGFMALSAFDSNLDGVIDANDTNFTALKIWQDINTNAVTDAGELQTLADFDITSINLTASAPQAGEEIIDGNRIAAVSSFTRGDGTTSTIADVVLTVDNFNTTYLGDTSISIEAETLPELKGHGVLPDLRIAMSRDPAFRAIVETELPNLNVLDLDTMRAAATVIFTAWTNSSAAGAVASINDKDIPILVSIDTEGKSQIEDFGIFDDVLEHWVLASGKDVKDANGDIILEPTAADILNINPADLNIANPQDYSWDEIQSAELNFYEHYFGEPLALGATPVAGANLADLRSAAIGIIENVEQTLDILAVRLAAQGPLQSFFEDIAYNVEQDGFEALTDRQLAPTYENILSAAQSQTDPLVYLASWERVLKLVMTNFDRGKDYLKISHNYVFANIVAAHEAISSSLDILDTAEALGVARDYIITGAGEMLGTNDHDIFYLNGGDQIAKGGAGFDVYVIGKNFGNDIIEDIETVGQNHIPDLIRFADTKSTDVIATREGQDLVITVTATGDTLRVVRQFEGEQPGLFGGFLDEGTGVQEITFVDGVVWDAFDIAEAVSHKDDTSLDLIGTESVDFLDGGAGDDRLEGAGDGDVYYFGNGYGHDTIFDSMNNILVDGDDQVIFEDGLVFTDLTFSRNGSSNDLEILLNGTSDQLTIEDQFNTFNSGSYGILNLNQIELFWFGTQYYTNEDIILEVINNLQTTEDDVIYGFYRQDTLDGGAGNDFLSGENDSDTYIFGKGYGADTIQEGADNILTASIDRVLFNEDVNPEDVIFSSVGNDKSITISFVDDSSTLHINDQYEATYVLGEHFFNRIESFEFQDDLHTTITWEEVAALALDNAKSENNDTIYGFDLDDRLDGGLGDDYLSGGNENDTYIYGTGYGHDIIDENYENILSGNFDIVEFQDGIALTDIIWERAGDSVDVIAHLSAQDTLTINNQFYYGGLGTGSYDEIEEYHFSDGSVLTLQELKILLLESTDGADVIYGYYSSDYLDGGLGDDYLNGVDGDDSYYFDIGYGHDTIHDDLTIVSISGNDKVIFGPGFTANDLILTRNNNDLDITFTNSTDKLTIINQNTTLNYDQIEAFQFSDGTVWDLAYITSLAENITGTNGNDILNGSPLHDVISGLDGDDELNGGSGSDDITGGLGNDVLKGSYGADTYFYNLGDGQDEINDSGYSPTNEIDKLILGTGFSSTDAFFSLATNQEDVILTFNGIAGSILLTEQLGNNLNIGLEEIYFSDGVIWDRNDIVAYFSSLVDGPIIYGTNGNDVINGTSDDENFEAGLGDDTINGLNGSDNYLYSSGDGNDQILEGSYNTGSDQLIFKDLNLSDVSFARSASDLNDVSVIINGTGETIKLDNQLHKAASGVEGFIFADGSNLSADETSLRDLARFLGTAGDDTINGSTERDVFDTGLGDDTLNGNNGGDTFYYASGDGNDQILEGSYNTGSDQLIFKDLNLSDISFARSASDLNDVSVIINGTGETIKLDNQLHKAASGVEEIIFADNTTITTDEATIRDLAKFFGTTGDDIINGSTERDVFDTGLGDDTLKGNNDSDSYYYASGDGNDLITEFYYHTGTDQLIFKDLNQSDLSFAASSIDSDDLIITINNTGETIMVDEQFYNATAGIEEIIFSDGSTLLHTDFLNI